MLKFTAKDREQLTEFKRSWFIFLIFGFLAFSPLWIDAHFGHAWYFAASVTAILIWFVIRPWRFGLLTEKSRRDIRIGWSFAVCIVPLFAVFRYLL